MGCFRIHAKRRPVADPTQSVAGHVVPQAPISDETPKSDGTAGIPKRRSAVSQEVLASTMMEVEALMQSKGMFTEPNPFTGE